MCMDVILLNVNMFKFHKVHFQVVNYQQSEIFVPWLVQYGTRKSNQRSQSSFNTITVQHFVITILINNTMFIMTTNIVIIITLIYNYYYHHHHNYSLPLFTEF